MPDSNNEFVFFVPDVMCGGCIETVVNMIKNNWPEAKHGSISCSGSALSRTVTIKSNHLKIATINQELSKILGETFTFVPEPSVELLKKMKKSEQKSHWFLGIIGVMLGCALLALPFLSISVPFNYMIAVASVSVATTLILGGRFYYNALTKPLSMDLLLLISTLSLTGISVASFFIPGLPMMFEGSLLVLGLRHIGLAIESSVIHDLGVNNYLQEHAPKTIFKNRLNQPPQEVNLNDLMAGDEIIIQPGMMLPVDGVCVLPENEYRYVDTVNINGSLYPNLVKSGEKLLSGMVLASNQDPLVIKILGKDRAIDSYLARCERSIRENTNNASLSDTTAKILTYFIPMIISTSVITGVSLSYFFPPIIALRCAINVLVSACPCTLGLVVPLALNLGARQSKGILFSHNKVMEKIASTKKIMIDLHGTLTNANPTVKPICNPAINAYLPYFLLLEQQDSHQVARAITDFAGKLVTKEELAMFTMTDYISKDRCISAKINGEKYYLGDERAMPPLPEKWKNVCATGERVTYLAREVNGTKEVVAYLVIANQLRPESPIVVQSLLDNGYDLEIFTGGLPKEAEFFASKLKLDKNKVIAGCSHDDKLKRVQDAQKQAPVWVIGDGLNDNGALGEAHFSSVVKHANQPQAITPTNADTIIESESLVPLLTLLKVSQYTNSIMYQNLMFSLVYNVAAMGVSTGMFLTTGLMLNPGVGVALMIFQMGVIFLNSARLTGVNVEPLPECPALA